MDSADTNGWNKELTKEQKEVLAQIKHGLFSEADYRDANLRALSECCEDDMLYIMDLAERLVRRVKNKNSRIQMSVEGAIEVLASIGRLLMTPKGRSYLQDLDKDKKYHATEADRFADEGRSKVASRQVAEIPTANTYQSE